VEERRRLKIIPHSLGERAVLKLMIGALIRAAERWRSVKVIEFERRQLAAVQKSSKQSRQRMMLQSDYPEILELDLGSAKRQSYFCCFLLGENPWLSIGVPRLLQSKRVMTTSGSSARRSAGA
jgi:hypothetical protein